jgi:rod shape-determining protein MreC
VVKNSYRLNRNYLTIAAGTKDGVTQDMGVINPLGIVGIVEKSATYYSTVQSVLNIRSRINAKIETTEYFGSLIWDGNDPTLVQLIDIPNVAQISVGDRIVTGGMSSIFPEGIPIGQVQSFELNKAQSDYIINVHLFNDLRALNTAYVIVNKDQKEVQQLDSISESR